MATSATRNITLSLAGLDEQIGYLLRRAQLAAFAHFNESLRSVKLTPGKFSVLLLIHENPGAAQSSICATLDILKSHLVAVIKELERRKLVQRTPHSKDARANELRLTARGKDILKKAVALNNAHEEKLHGQFSKSEQRRLMADLKRLAQIKIARR